MFDHAPGRHVVERQGCHFDWIVGAFDADQFRVRQDDVSGVGTANAHGGNTVSDCHVTVFRHRVAKCNDLADEVVSRCEARLVGAGVGISAGSLDVIDASDAGYDDTDQGLIGRELRLGVPGFPF